MLTTSRLASLSNWIPPETQLPQSHANSSPLDARGADWRGLHLGNSDLSGACLCRVDLRGTDLSGCQLNEADLRLARYDGHTLWPANFAYRSSGAVGPQAKLNGAFLNCADLSGMDMHEASLMGAYLSGADLSGACLRGVRLSGADLRYSLLRGALCEGARLSGCQLDYVDFRYAFLANADLCSAESIRGADFRGASDLDPIRETLLGRSVQELDCWNPLTRHTTRDSLIR